jgi:hypothetical protein
VREIVTQGALIATATTTYVELHAALAAAAEGLEALDVETGA